jgi:poly(A) polymerase Pap1
MKLEYVDSLTLAHPFVKGFEQVSYCYSDEEVRAVAQGEVSDTIKCRKKEDIEGKEGASTVHSTTFYIGLMIEPKQRAYPVFLATRSLESVDSLAITRSWCYRSSKTRHILSNHRIYETGQNVGKI